MNAFGLIFNNLRELVSWWVVVAPWEQAIRVRAGKHVALLTAGIYLRLPFIDRVYRQSIRRRLTVIRAQTLTTKDGKVLTVSGALGYSIGDLRKLYDKLESAQSTIETEVNALVARFVAENDLASAGPRQIAEHVARHLDLTKYGFGEQEFHVTNFVSARTYRLIQGDLHTWSHDDPLRMTEPPPR